MDGVVKNHGELQGSFTDSAPCLRLSETGSLIHTPSEDGVRVAQWVDGRESA